MPAFIRRHLLSRCLALALYASSAAHAAGLLEKEVQFSESEVQAEIDKRGPQEKRFGNLLTANMPQPPTVRLGKPDGRATIAARVMLSIGEAPAVPVDLTGTAGLRYDDVQKAFYIDKPEAESVESNQLAPQYQTVIRQALSQMMQSYFRNQPVYRLRADASPQEATARWLLRSVRIEPGKVIAVLAPN